MLYAEALFFAVLLTTVLVPPLMKFAVRVGMVDRPDERKVHTEPVPRSGGIAVVVGALVPLFFLVPSKQLVLGISLGAMVILVEAILDDMWRLSYRFKFGGQVLAAVVTIYATDLHLTTLGEPLPGWVIPCGLIGYPLTVIFLVATTNIINLSDGLDGLAGGICLLIFAGAGFLAFTKGDFTTVAFCMCMTGAIIGFLRYNTYPAVVFLGDAGSQFLGFMAGVTLLLFTAGGASPRPIVAMYLLGIPVLDTLVAVVRRAVEKRPLFKPDKTHLHHRLLELGIEHHQAVTVIYVAQVLMIAAGWGLRAFFSDAVLYGIYLGLMAFAVLAVIFRFSNFRERFGRNVHLNGFLHGADNGGPKQHAVLSRKFVSKTAWVSLMAALLVFYIFSPICMSPVRSDVGGYSLGLMIVLALVRFVRPAFFVFAAKIAGYFLAIYYIAALDFSAGLPESLLNGGARSFLLGIFILMAVSYSMFLIATFEKFPLTPMDYLLLGVVALTFLLPEPIRAEYHVHTMAVKILLIFLSLELVALGLKDRIDILASAAFPSLGLNFLMAIIK